MNPDLLALSLLFHPDTYVKSAGVMDFVTYNGLLIARVFDELAEGDFTCHCEVATLNRDTPLHHFKSKRASTRRGA